MSLIRRFMGTPSVLVFLMAVSPSFAADTRPAVGLQQLPPDLQRQVLASIERAMDYFKSAQEPEGGWVEPSGPSITALVAQCVAQNPQYGPAHPVVRKALQFMLKSRQPDGGIYNPADGLRNYGTSVCLMFLSALPETDPTVRAAREEAVRYLQQLQWGERHKDSQGKPITPEHVWYGGAGYGKEKRPDLSNTQMMLEALKQSGLPSSDPTYQRALKFVERCQMLSETNDQPFARHAEDGGFIYTPANGGESKAGTVIVDGRPMLRSYGSMTYAGFKSMLYANVSRDDARVRRALDWIARHYTLDENPNLPGQQSKQGLYYYYHVFARALYAWGEPTITDVKGNKHNWRVDLVRKLISLQRPDGSWVNEADRWMEGLPQLVTAYSVLALQTAIK
jgi:squalene-hopene/tetraprenyl-beta-curcumene cyclase